MIGSLKLSARRSELAPIWWHLLSQQDLRLELQLDIFRSCFRRCADDDENALRFLFQARLQMNAIGPHVDIAPGREVAPGPGRMIVLPAFLQPTDRRCRRHDAAFRNGHASHVGDFEHPDLYCDVAVPFRRHRSGKRKYIEASGCWTGAQHPIFLSVQRRKFLQRHRNILHNTFVESNLAVQDGLFGRLRCP